MHNYCRMCSTVYLKVIIYAISINYKGCWLTVGNGYLAWLTTITPIKTIIDRREIRWSEWMESIRKDVECTFGILKGRFRIVKTGIFLHGVECAEKFG
jgi:Plant transposon protein